MFGSANGGYRGNTASSKLQSRNSEAEHDAPPKQAEEIRRDAENQSTLKDGEQSNPQQGSPVHHQESSFIEDHPQVRCAARSVNVRKVFKS